MATRPELMALHLEDGASLVVGLGSPDQFHPGSPPDVPAADPSRYDEVPATLSFEVEITGIAEANEEGMLVSWIVDPKIRDGDTHWWSAGSYPTAYVNTSGTIKAGGTVVSYPHKGKVYSKGFEVTTNDTVVDYEMTGKRLYLNGKPYPNP